MKRRKKAITRKKTKKLRKLAKLSKKKPILTPEAFIKDFYKRNRALMTKLAYD